MRSLIISGLSVVLLSTGSVLPLQAPLRAMEPSSETLTAQNKQTGVALRTLIRQNDTLYLSPGDSHAQNLRLDASASVGGRNFPAGSIVRGSFEPIQGGLQYVATSIEVGNQIYNLNAASGTLHDQKDPRETGVGDILTDAGIGAAGGLVLGEIFGDAGFLEILGGAAAGAVVGNVTAPQVVVLEPNEAIILTTR